jgi:CRP-like cAMP-binding protein
MKEFNLQFANHPKLEQLKQFILEHGTYIELKKGELFSIQGKMNHRGAYIENGLLRYTRVDERGNIHIVGYTFSGEFTGSLCTLIAPNQPSLVTIEAVCDTRICYMLYSEVEKFFATNAETMQIKCILVEQSYLLMYHRLLDMHCKTTEEQYLDLLDRCPDIQEYITLKEIASFLQVTPETISRIRHKLRK